MTPSLGALNLQEAGKRAFLDKSIQHRETEPLSCSQEKP